MINQAGALARDILMGGSPAPIYHLGSFSASMAGHTGERWLDHVACSVAIGVFDGCHIGHQELIARTVADARARGIAAVAVTFDPDPDTVVAPAPALKLMTTADRLHALALSGVDFVVVVPFTRELAALDHVGFFTQVLAPALDVRAVHVGSDFKLGRRGASTVEVIRAWGAGRGMDVFGHDLVLEDGGAVTATRVRIALAQGDLGTATRELGRRYVVCGEVGAGRGQGTGMGFPTANVDVPAGIQMPREGVYAGYGVVCNRDGSASAWPAAINAGVPPMFAKSARSAKLEANLLGFGGDLYGSQIGIVFDTRLRDSATFDTLDELIATVNHDIESTRSLFGDTEIAIRP